MDGLTAAMIGFGITILGALALIAPKIPGWIERAVEAYLKRLEVPAQLKALDDSLKANTQLTQEARDASNGRLSEMTRLNQNLQAELFDTRRLIDAVGMDAEGQAALARARARLDSLKVLRPG